MEEGGVSIDKQREICCNFDDYSKKEIPLFHRRTGKLIR